MAGKTGQSPTDLEQDLLENASAYDFYQAVRLLTRLISQKSETNNRQTCEDKLKIQPELNLDHPDSELSSIQALPETEGYSITTTFMGLYGISSPLPAYYTEDLLDEEWDEGTVSRDFLDIIHHHLYPLLYRAWLKYRISHNAIEANDTNYWDILFSLFGLGIPEFQKAAQNPYDLLPYLGLLTQQPKSLVALETLLKDYLNTTNLNIIPCVERTVDIPLDQQVSLGKSQGVLGQSAVLGAEQIDRMGKFSIQIGPMDAETFQRFQGNSDFFNFIHFIIKFYLNQPLEVELALKIDKNEIKSAKLGMSDWSCLGKDTWLYDKGNKQQVTVVLGI